MEMINNPQGIRIQRREWYDHLQSDISPLCRRTPEGVRAAFRIADMWGSPLAIRYFAKFGDALDDYSYWFLLGTCWVSYTGFYEISLWKQLFNSTRPHRDACLMKPTERRFFRHALPKTVHCFRVHRPGEKDWISYTLDLDTAKRIAAARSVAEIHKYAIARHDLIALFLRRNEYEILCLAQEKANLLEVVPAGGTSHAESLDA